MLQFYIPEVELVEQVFDDVDKITDTEFAKFEKNMKLKERDTDPAQ